MCTPAYDGTTGNWLYLKLHLRFFFVEFLYKTNSTDSLSKIFLKYDFTLTQHAGRIFLSVRHMGISSYPLDLMHITMLKLADGVGKYPKASTYTCFPKIPPAPPASVALVAAGFGFFSQNKRDGIFSHLVSK